MVLFSFTSSLVLVSTELHGPLIPPCPVVPGIVAEPYHARGLITCPYRPESLLHENAFMKPSDQAFYFPSAAPQTEGKAAIQAGDVGLLTGT